MKKNDLAERLASRTRTTPGVAADQLDRIVHHIIQSLKEGKPASLPGLGVFTPLNRKPGFRFEAQPGKTSRGRAKS
ncbi:MAG: HU family DNA-binding protein [Bryobacterales bacterium]|nr:HU family DNA-binding protein [Bryobacterales bacterium]